MVQSAGRNLLRTEQLSTRGFDKQNINFTLSSGSRIGILGGTGSGKTSLLRALACLDPLSNVKLFLGDDDVSRKSLWRMKKRQGYVSLLLANPYSLFNQRKRISTLLHDIENDVGRAAPELLQDKKIPVAASNLPVTSLSGLMRIRLALIRIKHNQSPLVLVDDIFRHVMPEVWHNASHAITGIVDNTQALLITSQFYECLRSMDFILVIHDGVFVEGGRREDVFSSPSHPITRSLIHRKGNGPVEPTLIRLENLTTLDDTINNDPISLSPGHWVLPP